MAKYYAKTKEIDSKGRRYFTDDLPQLDSADGLVEVTVPDEDLYPQYFTQYWNKGYYLDKDGNLVSPKNLPDVQIGFLLEQIRVANKRYEVSQGKLTDLTSKLDQANTKVTQLESNLTQTQAALDQAQDALLEVADAALSNATPVTTEGGAE